MPADQLDITEIRVHGVSGTPPDSALNCPAVIEVAGTATPAFTGPRPATGSPRRPRTASATRPTAGGT